jgi:hypothetical protein
MSSASSLAWLRIALDPCITPKCRSSWNPLDKLAVGSQAAMNRKISISDQAVSRLGAAKPPTRPGRVRLSALHLCGDVALLHGCSKMWSVATLALDFLVQANDGAVQGMLLSGPLRPELRASASTDMAQGQAACGRSSCTR